MPSVKVYKMDGTEAGTLKLNEKVFGVEYNEPLIHQAVVTRLANERQGTKSTLTRTEVRGGVVFAPKSRDFSKDMNKKAKVAALLSALSKKVADGELVVVDSLEVKEGKTKEMVAFQTALKLDKTCVVVMDNNDEKVILAARNLPNLSTLPVAQISTYEVVANAKVVMTKAAIKKIEEVYGE